MGRVYNPDLHHRQSVRLKGFDYTQAGPYFVTVVVQGRAPLFGDVKDGEIQLNGAGQAVQRIWNRMPDRFPGVEMDAFVVMPNHIHGIIVIHATSRPLDRPVEHVTAMTRAASGNDVGSRFRLSDVVGIYKSLTTAEYIQGVKSLNWPPFHGRLWQRNYYDHIVRGDKSLRVLRQYILDNPSQWDSDRENPMAINAN